MLTAQAHSFTQQARLAITLAWVAGYTNIVAILTCAHAASHVSGTASELGRGAATGVLRSAGVDPGGGHAVHHWDLALLSAFVLGTFFLGAVLSGVLSELGRRRAWESIYVLPVAAEAALLAMFAIGVEMHDATTLNTGPEVWWMMGVASAAMGLQNATITRISSGVVRTTHMTGIVTDLGIEVAHALFGEKRAGVDAGESAETDRGPVGSAGAIARLMRSVRRHESARRLALLSGILVLFVLGAALGTLGHAWMPRLVMFPPVFFLLLVIYQDLSRPIAEIDPSELENEDLGLPESVLVMRLRSDRQRRGRVQRLPNLMMWSDRLAAHTRVVILDLTGVSELDGYAGYELGALLKRFALEQRRLILAGLTPAQYERLRRGGAGESLHPGVVCADLELALARGLMLAQDEA
ncbi:MAG: DUF1275 family protein [Phycisphaerales bacterium]